MQAHAVVIFVEDDGASTIDVGDVHSVVVHVCRGAWAWHALQSKAATIGLRVVATVAAIAITVMDEVAWGVGSERYVGLFVVGIAIVVIVKIKVKAKLGEEASRGHDEASDRQLLGVCESFYVYVADLLDGGAFNSH